MQTITFLRGFLSAAKAASRSQFGPNPGIRPTDATARAPLFRKIRRDVFIDFQLLN
jgi:hypothetical protein